MGVIADKIRQAIFGSEVRESIADGIEATELLREDYDKQVINAGNSNAEIVDARGSFTKLKDRLDGVDSSLADIPNQINEAVSPKADKVYVDSKFGSMGSTKTYKGSCLYANLPIEGMVVDDYWYVSDQDTNYCWNGTVWGDIGNNLKVGEKSLSIDALTVSKAGKNLFDLARILIDQTLSSAGTTYGLAGYNTTNYYIDILPSLAYAFTNGYYVCWYDADKAFISRSNLSVNTIIISPSNAYFAKITVLTDNLNTAQMELGDECTDYESFKYIVPKEYVEKPDIEVNDLPTGIPYNKTDFVLLGKNLCNPGTITKGYYVSESSGVILANASYDVTDFITILGNTQYCIGVVTVNVRIAFYDQSKKYISGILGLTNPIITPENAVYIRFSFNTGKIPQLEKSSTISAYEPYGYEIPNLLFKKDEILVFLPDEIYVASGRTIELYNKQVAWCGNINNFHFQWDCTIGKAMKRKFSITGTDALIGEYALSLTVYDNHMVVVATASTTIKIVSAVINTPKNILTIGDSLSNNKPWLGELRTLSNNMFTMVGTRGTAPLNHEGRSGFSAASYLVATEYTYESEGVQPFWDATNGRFNWNYYKTTYGINPDAVQIYLGTNNINLVPDTNAGNIKQIVDYIRQDDVSIPIYLVFTLYRGDQDGIGSQLDIDGYSSESGAWKLEEDRKVYNLMVKLYELLSSYSNLYFVPISLCHDSEYNFKSTEPTPVNPRSAITEYMDAEATHPSTTNAGYYQMADIMFSIMAAH